MKIKDLKDMESSRPFISSRSEEAIYKNAIHYVGFCFDGTVSFRPGSRFGPDALRDASFGLETYSSYLDKDLEDLSLIDIGNLPIYPSNWLKTNTYFHEMTKDLNLIKDHIKFITFGGEHSISYGPIRLYLDQYKDLVIIHLDAHADLRDGYLGEKYSHASIIRRVADHMSDQNELIQYGIRSGLKSEFEWMKKNKTISESLDHLLTKVKNLPDDRPIYLTLDLDYFDPAFLPGTGTPEAGGEDFHSFIRLIKILSQKNFVGADVVELAPMLDASGNSNAFASKVVREITLALK